MKFVVYKQWDQLPESVNALFSESEQASLFFSRSWLENLSAYALADHQSILLVCIIEDESCLAIMPMMESSRDGVCSLSNHFTTLYSLLVCNHGEQRAIITCLAEGLSKMSIQAVRLEPINPIDGNMTMLRHYMESCGYESYPYFRFHNWIHHVNGQSFDNYMAERPANIRNMIRRKQRKLNREQAYDIRLTQDLNIGDALADYQLVYQSSWKANEIYANFTPNLVKNFAKLGWLRLAILYIEEKPVAAQIWFVAHRKASIYRLAYDDRWKRYSPGSILTHYLMRHVIDTDKVLEIDFLTGNERYKQDWMTIQRERLGVRFVKKSAQKNSFIRMLQSVKNKI